METRSKVGGAADAQPAFVDGTHMVFGDIVSVDFDILEAREVRSEKAADSAAADNADFHTHAVLRTSAPE